MRRLFRCFPNFPDLYLLLSDHRHLGFTAEGALFSRSRVYGVNTTLVNTVVANFYTEDAPFYRARLCFSFLRCFLLVSCYCTYKWRLECSFLMFS